MRNVFGSVAILLILACTKAEAPPPPPQGPVVSTQEVSYQEGDLTLRGFAAWDSAKSEKRPGIVVVHEWWGHNAHAREQARRLAEAGYVGFALDMYGDGRNTTHPDSAQAFMMAAVADQDRMVKRFQAAIEQLKQNPHVDPDRISAIGYCFGGMVVLSMARSGADLDAVGSFHGAIPPEAKIDSGTVKARVLILTGGADPMVPMAQVDAFAAAMRAAGASVDVFAYEHAQHGFTNPGADSVQGVPGLRYDAEADRQSFQKLVEMLRSVYPS